MLNQFEKYLLAYSWNSESDLPNETNELLKIDPLMAQFGLIDDELLKHINMKLIMSRVSTGLDDSIHKSYLSIKLG